jgi:ribonucleoside-diphosphate reductase alpha chain
MTDEEESLTRMISTALRHGSSIDFIVEQLNKSNGTVVSFNKAISRVLSKYAKELNLSKSKCESCGSKNISFEEGCFKCYECGNSKCGS